MGGRSRLPILKLAPCPLVASAEGAVGGVYHSGLQRLGLHPSLFRRLFPRPRYLGFVPYYVAKAGVKALSEALALELAPDRILVNTIAPGPIVAPPGTTAEEYAAVEKATPLGRWGGEAEIAKAVLTFLDSDFMTGETVRVDGGRHLR